MPLDALREQLNRAKPYDPHHVADETEPTEPATAAHASADIAVTLKPASSFRVEPIRWLWQGWLAMGKVHILAGSPGTGKTSISMAMAATISMGGRWPDGTRAAPGDVVIWSGEDDPADTLIPRLMAAGADLSRVQVVIGAVGADGARSFDPAEDVAALADALGAMDPPPALLIVDPIVSAVAGDSHKNAEVRRALQPLVDLAMARRVAVLGITHFSKGSTGRDPVERVTGSLAFGALARIVMAAAKRSDEDGGGRILARGKSNIGRDDGGFLYDLDICEAAPGIETTRILWGEPIEGTARDLLGTAESASDPEERSMTSEAMDWLREHLADGPRKSKDCQREAREAGISDKALRTARERLGIKPTKGGFSGGWYWDLPRQDAPAPSKMPNMPIVSCPETEGHLGILGQHGHLRDQGDGHATTDADEAEGYF
jgi:putative DNA primase/helicase